MASLKIEGEVQRDRAMVNTTVDKKIFEEFKRTCKAQGMRMSTLLELFMKQYSEGDFHLKFTKEGSELDLNG